MTETGKTILGHLATVAAERQARSADPRLASDVERLKAFQHRRFEACYADLLASPRFGPAAKFFLEDLYGPWDFSARDAQFARIVPALVRLFPAEIVGTVADLAELHALSERLDGEMASALAWAGAPIDDLTYADAWRQVGQRGARLRQITLMRVVGEALDRYTRRPALRRTLRLMRYPARAAGLEALHAFLERGFDTFLSMNGADEFLDAVVSRETRLAERMFDRSGLEAAARHGLVVLATQQLVQLP